MEESIDWKKYRAEFPASEEYVYLNTAAISPMSLRVRDAVDEVNDLFVRKGMLCEEEVFGRVEAVRASAAALMGASSDEIAFIKNTTQGVLIAANGISWKSGDNVVLPANEFPANVYPWMGLTRRGVELRLVEPEDGKVTAEMISDVCDERTRAVTVSYVQFSNGYRIDCEELGTFCRDRDIFLHVDAIHALGALQIDTVRDKIDLLSCGGHKWMLTAPGIGLFYCRRELIERLDIPNPGWTGVVGRDEYLDYDFTYRKDAMRFEEGSPNLMGIFAIGASIERFLEIGKKRLEERIMALGSLLAEGLTERGYTVTSSLEESERSGIVCFDHAKEESSDIHQRLMAGSVVCALREGAIRLSPHIYNNERDIDRFFNVLEVN